MRIAYLVRHGQASFGKRDYDALSDLGHLQSRTLGRELAAREIRPDLIIRGELRRHRETAEGILEGLEFDVPVEVDAGWDEFDFQHVVEIHKPLYRSRTMMLADLARTRHPKAAFQAVFEDATARWTGGAFDSEYVESFPAFTGRVEGALERMAARGPAKGTVVVVSSGGPIGLAASLLLAGDASLWGTLNRVAVNTGVTKVINGRSGLNLSSYNSHTHVEHDRDLLTYR
ncbi:MULTISPECIES: histidine phosphatase family protein [unclassified Nocardioides]|uniref:histidine phosphatase family protein n=1 Tax=unclassified Nocardioides TaxID=2615069 RepID=UPI0006FDB676|nr:MULTISPECIES: histidine phosphatase family protein [unclassified Nocardioides]KRA37643.1 phosphoglycerate mutase [Nocardioides sp. Root614]KRA91603.1 phosphoglycerate mutase [Nocardioides sp. Root682]